MFEFLESLAVTWVIHVLVGALLAIPTFLITRRKFAWKQADLLAFVIPWLAWFIVFAIGPKAASITSAVCESVLLGGAIGCAFIALPRLRIKSIGPVALRIRYLGFLCAFAILMWALFPFIGE